MKAFWFGCSTPPAPKGHGLNPYPYNDCPFRWDQLDGVFAPKNGHEEFAEGRARLTHIKGTTIVAFWDRTGDSRGGSNTAFIFDEILDGETALREARERWPDLWKRFTFPVEIVETVENG